MRTVFILLMAFLGASLVIAEERRIDLATLGLEGQAMYQIFKIQDQIMVPDPKVVKFDLSYLIYHSEYHNGSENGTLLIVCQIVGKKVREIFRMEESFLLDDGSSFKREITGIEKGIAYFKLYSVAGKTKKVLAEYALSFQTRTVLPGAKIYYPEIKDSLLFFAETNAKWFKLNRD